jgi:hypothetical protein
MVRSMISGSPRSDRELSITIASLEMNLQVCKSLVGGWLVAPLATGDFEEAGFLDERIA